MAEIRTFSSIVDKTLLQTGRKSTIDVSRVKDYTRQTIRELRVKEFFARDMIEIPVTATSDDFIWPRPKSFRMMRTVEYPNRFFPDNIPPGKLQKHEEQYWYAGIDYMAFIGIGTGSVIKLAYYRYPRRFIYYPNGVGTAVPDRPAYYDDELEIWFFLEGTNYLDEVNTNLTVEQQEEAKDKVSDWLLFDWDSVVPEGTSAKLFKQTDEARARSSFALFKSFENDLLKGEPYESLGF